MSNKAEDQEYERRQRAESALFIDSESLTRIAEATERIAEALEILVKIRKVE